MALKDLERLTRELKVLAGHLRENTKPGVRRAIHAKAFHIFNKIQGEGMK